MTSAVAVPANRIILGVKDRTLQTMQDDSPSGGEVEVIVRDILEDNSFAIAIRDNVDELLGEVMKEMRRRDIRKMKMGKDCDKREMTLCCRVETVEISE
jgi:hypothetical protein